MCPTFHENQQCMYFFLCTDQASLCLKCFVLCKQQCLQTMRKDEVVYVIDDRKGRGSSPFLPIMRYHEQSCIEDSTRNKYIIK